MTARHWCPIGVVLIAVLNADGVAANAAIGRGVPATAAIPPERAEVEPLEVEVTVVDEKLRPVAGALVEAIGERTTSFVGRTGEAGVVTVRVKRGQHLAARDGSAVSSVEAAVSATLRLVVRLQNIGSVRARGAQERTTAASARALISGSITGGLGYVPDYRSAAQGGSGRQSLNGVPLDLPAPPGTASASGGIPSDLISSFDAVQADDGSYPDYHLLAPTPDFRATFTAGAASSDGSLWKASMAGPHGNLHYALALAAGGDDGRLAGQTFSDNSGVRYDHATGERHTAVSLTGNTQLGPVNVAFLGFDTNRSAAYITTNRPGDIVNGLGPGNRTGGDTGLEFLLATWSHGHDSFSAIDGRYRGAGTFDFTHALVDGIATPSDSGYRYDGRFESVNWTHSFGPNALSLKAAANENTSNAFYRTNDSPVQSGGGWVRTGSQMLSLAYRVGHGDASAGASLTAQRAGGAFAGSFLDATAFAARRIAGIDARIAVAATEAQTQEASYATTYSLAPPQTAAVT